MSMHITMRRLAYAWPMIKVKARAPAIGIEVGDIVHCVQTTPMFVSKSSRDNSHAYVVALNGSVYLVTNVEPDATGWTALGIMGADACGWVWMSGTTNTMEKL